MNDAVRVSCPLFLLTTTAACWKCGTAQLVTGLGSHRVVEDGMFFGDEGDTSELVLLSNVEVMPQEVLDYVEAANPRYAQPQSNTARSTYYANTCECGALFGDF